MYVFVYGTLTDPDRVETVLEGHQPVEYTLEGRATLEGLHRVDGRYPTLAPGGSVEGRLLWVDRTGLEVLDRYEGVDEGLYVRVTVPCAGREEGVEVYVGDPDRLGVDDWVEWPDGSSFADQVRRTIRSTDVVVSNPE